MDLHVLVLVGRLWCFSTSETQLQRITISMIRSLNWPWKRMTLNQSTSRHWACSGRFSTGRGRPAARARTGAGHTAPCNLRLAAWRWTHRASRLALVPDWTHRDAPRLALDTPRRPWELGAAGAGAAGGRRRGRGPAGGRSGSAEGGGGLGPGPRSARFGPAGPLPPGPLQMRRGNWSRPGRGGGGPARQVPGQVRPRAPPGPPGPLRPRQAPGPLQLPRGN